MIFYMREDMNFKDKVLTNHLVIWCFGYITRYKKVLSLLLLFEACFFIINGYIYNQSSDSIINGSFATITCSLIALEIAVITIWFPIMWSYKQKDVENFSLIRNLEDESVTSVESIIDLFNIKNSYYTCIGVFSILLFCLLLGLLLSVKNLFFLLQLELVLFGISIIYQINLVNTFLTKIQPSNNISSLILKNIDNEVKNLNINGSHVDISNIYNKSTKQADSIIANYCLEIFRNKEMRYELQIKNIVFLIQEAWLVRQRMVLKLKPYIDDKYIWSHSDIVKDESIIKNKIIYQKIDLPILSEVINTIFESKDKQNLLLEEIIRSYIYEGSTNDLEFPFPAFLFNFINNNTEMVEDLYRLMALEGINSADYKKTISINGVI